MSDVKRINVAVGIAFNSDGEVLVGQRTVQDQYFEKWEFPGGKLEAGESSSDALAREFLEEVGIRVQNSTHFMEVSHDYPDRKVCLHIRLIERFSGDVKALEGQALQWIGIAMLRNLDFLQGNQVIIDKLESEFG